MIISLFLTEKLVFILLIVKLKQSLIVSSKINIKTIYVLKIESGKMKSYLLYYNDCLNLKGHRFYNINQMINNTKNHRCIMTYEQYMNYPMSMVEGHIKIIIAKNPDLINTLDRTKNHLLIGNYSHIPFNRI